jgi:hypothetical protein
MLIVGSKAVNAIAPGCELIDNVRREFLFDVQAVGQGLVMETRSICGLVDVEAVVAEADNVVRNNGDDSGTTRGEPRTGQAFDSS